MSCIVEALFQRDAGEKYRDLSQMWQDDQIYPSDFNLRLFNGDEALYFVFQQNRYLLSKEYSEQHSYDINYCYYEGRRDDEFAMLSALNLCENSISGMLYIQGRHFSFEHRDGSFFLLAEEQLFNDVPIRAGQLCRKFDNATFIQLANRSKRAMAASQPNEPPPLPGYYHQYLDGKWRYVELVLVSDHSMFIKYNKDKELLHKRMVSLANIVNSLYQPLHIRVTLVWAEVWADKNKSPVTKHADRTLEGFLNYRKSLLRTFKHDNAQLLTDTSFVEGIVGKAFKGTMCSYDFSGGLDVDYSKNVAVVASTLAHEMGHNFGMEHDTEPDCQCAASRCIMAPSTGGLAPSHWSDCSLEYLQHGLRRGVDYCLLNAPLSKRVFGGPKCGNGLVEDGEQCDCGATKVCRNKCCNAETCQLVQGARCASGPCCDLKQCMLKSASTPCRPSTNVCDLPEFCDGHTEHCPGDYSLQNGLPCPGTNPDHAYCYDGKCGSRTDQCQLLWGETGRKSPAECYQVNIQGTIYGNCGYNTDAGTYKACDDSNIMCGRLHCQHRNERTEFGDKSMVHSAHTFLRMPNGQSIVCRTVRMTYSNVYRKDPGMVPDGARCRKDQICIKSKCTSREKLAKITPKCKPADCYGLGVCNDMGNCHCDAGYGGIDCSIPGPGGSVNSGPSHGPYSINLYLTLFVICAICGLFFAALTYYCKKKRHFWVHDKIIAYLRAQSGHLNPANLRSKPVRTAPPPPIDYHRPATLSATSQRVDARWSTKSVAISAPLPQTGASKTAIVRPQKAPPSVPKRPDDRVLHQLYLENGRELSGTKMHGCPDIPDDPDNGRRPSNPPPPPPPPPPSSVDKSDWCCYDVVPAANTHEHVGKPPVAAKPWESSTKSVVRELASRYDPKSLAITSKVWHK